MRRGKRRLPAHKLDGDRRAEKRTTEPGSARCSQEGREEMQLPHKVAIVTGAATGIGEAIAGQMASEGAAVAIDYTAGQQDKAAGVVSRIEQTGGRAVAVEADVSKEDQVKRLIEQTVAAFGRLDIMV